VATSAALPIRQAATTLLNWRFPLSPQASSPATPFSLEDQPIPWEAKDIVPGSHVCCRKCANTIINEGSVASWKDLPSENWAEMMEFWHCHKPADHKHDEHEPVSRDSQRQQDEALTRRGYGASNAISAQPGVGFVDSVSFMFSESDCKGLLVSQTLFTNDKIVYGGKEVGPAGLNRLLWQCHRYNPPRAILLSSCSVQTSGTAVKPSANWWKGFAWRS
jgi:ubiquitin-protein ligase E3 D